MKTLKQLITFIIVNYNGANDTIKCVDSIGKQFCENAEINVIIVDNASNFNDIDLIKSYCEKKNWVEIIESPKNVGYFPAFNLAIDNHQNEIIKNKRTIVLCNNDLIFEKDFISKYLSKKYTPDTLVISPNVITLDGRHQNPHVKNRFSSFRKFLLWLYFTNYYIGLLLSLISSVIKKRHLSTQKKESQFIYAGIGACYILPSIFFEKIDKLEERLFLGGEELVLAAKVISVGGRNYFDSGLVVIHAEGIAFSKKTTRWRYEQSKNSYSIYKNLL